MKLLTLTTTLALIAITAFPGVTAEPNEAQSGDNSDCVDYNALYDVGGVFSPLAAIVTVEGGTNFTVSHNGGAAVYVDFYDASGTWISWNSGALSGRVPLRAVTGTICVGLLDSFPDLPAPGATWTYQDGF